MLIDSLISGIITVLDAVVDTGSACIGGPINLITTGKWRGESEGEVDARRYRKVGGICPRKGYNPWKEREKKP